MKNFVLGILFTLAVLYPQYSVPKIQSFMHWAHTLMMGVVKWMANI